MEELDDLYSSPDIVRVSKLRRMMWAGNVARKGEREINICGIPVCEAERRKEGVILVAI